MVKVKGCPVATNGHRGVAVRKPTCTDSSVTEVGGPSSSSPPSPSPDLKRVRYCYGEQRAIEKSRAQAVCQTQTLQQQWRAL